ncbi:MAG: hypothetical protein A2Y40_09050 [Candidatus Margulisbacteria bacterium GWF2_35_9]|nr:MAG: hypothetical protein A2Y40_09050 [Candidatus Margulisbacteria bacterium GWF2_35_9]
MQELIRIRVEELQKLRDDLVAKQKLDLDKIDVRIDELNDMAGNFTSSVSPIAREKKEPTPLAPIQTPIVNEIKSIEEVPEEITEILPVNIDKKNEPQVPAKPILKEPLAEKASVAAIPEPKIDKEAPVMPQGLDDLIDNIAAKTEMEDLLGPMEDISMPPGFDDLVAGANVKDDLIMPDDGAKEMSNDDIEALLNAQLS